MTTLDSYYKDKPDYSGISSGRISGIKKLLGDYAGQTILDIGCGQGVLGRMLKADKQVTVHGIDISPRSIGIAKQFLEQADCVDIESEEGFAKFLKKTKYDAIVISEVLEHLFYPEKILRTIAQNVGPDTKIIITVPNLLYWKSRAKIALGRFEYGTSGLMDRGHIHFFSWKSFEKMIVAEGFKITGTAHTVSERILRPFSAFIPGFAAFQFIVRIQRDQAAKILK